MSGGVYSTLWASGSRAVAAAIGLGVVLKFLKWLVEFVFERLDVSRSHLGQRLSHVEAELDAWREFGMAMFTVVAKLDPLNPALGRISQILRTTAPRSNLDLDELAQRLSDIPGTKEMKQ